MAIGCIQRAAQVYALGIVGLASGPCYGSTHKQQTHTPKTSNTFNTSIPQVYVTQARTHPSYGYKRDTLILHKYGIHQLGIETANRHKLSEYRAVDVTNKLFNRRLGEI